MVTPTHRVGTYSKAKVGGVIMGLVLTRGYFLVIELAILHSPWHSPHNSK